MSKPIQTADIIFPVLSTDFSTTLSSLKRSTLSVSNRLRSIAEDAEFVCAVADAYQRPLVANERCGSWYIPPERKAASAYFKSTDGHTGEWSFSLRRLNIQVLELVGEHDGCIIVDSTRRGKRMPDALSKTIPIWCATLNALLFPSDRPPTLHTPPHTVSPSEHAQMAALLPSFLAAARTLSLPLDRLRSLVRKPLRPLWVTRDSPLPAAAAAPNPGGGGTAEEAFPDFHPLVLCTASRCVAGGDGGEAGAGGYVQGAGDDAEGWAPRGLTAGLFWAHKEVLLNTAEAELPGVIAELIERGGNSGGDAVSVVIAPAGWVRVCSADALKRAECDAVIWCGEEHAGGDEGLQERLEKERYLHLRCGAGKLGSRDLRAQIPKIEAFVRDRVPADGGGRLAIACRTGKDLAVGVALAVLCLYADDKGTRLRAPNPNPTITKPFIRQRLGWLMTAHPAASPSRATLQSVNAFLFSPRQPPHHPAPTTTTTTTSRTMGPATTTTTTTTTTTKTTPLSKTFAALTTAPPSSPWRLTRTLTSALPAMPSGTFTGTATFTPRAPTSAGAERGGRADAEYLYAEEGVLRTDGGLELPARRRYVWRYRAGTTAADGGGAGESITLWFVKEDGEGVDYLFLDMEFEGGGEGEGPLRAKGVHPCGEDVYDARFEFGGQGQEGGGGGMVVTYVVKGPRKDYVSETRYTR